MTTTDQGLKRGPAPAGVTFHTIPANIDDSVTARLVAKDIELAASLASQVLGDEHAIRLGGGLYQNLAAATRAGMVTDANNRRGKLAWVDLINEDYRTAFVPTDPALVREGLVTLAATVTLAIRAIDAGKIVPGDGGTN